MRPARLLSGVVCLAGLAAGCARAPVTRVEWPVMGTVAAVQARGEGAEAFVARLRARVQGRLAAIEVRLDAHDPASELNALATCRADEILDRCSPSVRPCYAAAFRLAELSRGAFDPRWRGTNTVDLGAIAKGFAVDCAAADWARSGVAADALVDLGGNLKSLGGVWRTGVRAPTGAGFAATVDLRAGEALATSATYYRGAHIADGRTGRPVSNDVASVTVLCRSAMWADGLSTALFVLGPDEGRTFLATHLSDLDGGLSASVLWIMKDGTQIIYGDARFQGN